MLDMGHGRAVQPCLLFAFSTFGSPSLVTIRETRKSVDPRGTRVLFVCEMEASIERNCWSFNLDRKNPKCEGFAEQISRKRLLAFPPSVLSAAWVRSMATCECRVADHDHALPCGASLRLSNRGREGEGGWEAHHVVPESNGGSDKIDNCAI